MSVWTSLEALQQYVYRSAHVGPLRDRKQWFEPMEGPILALWWISAGHVPTVAEAMERLAHLKAHGPTPHAFTFRAPFPAPEAASTEMTDSRPWYRRSLLTRTAPPAPARAGPPQRLRHLLAPAQPVISQLFDLLGVRRRKIVLLADIVREVEQLRAGQIGIGGVRHEQRTFHRLHQLPRPFADRHVREHPPVQRFVGRPLLFAGQIWEQVDAIELPVGARFDACGRKRGREHIHLNDGTGVDLPLRKRPFQRIMKGTRMPPSHVCRFDPRSGVLVAPLIVVPSIVGPPLSLKKKISVFSSRPSARSAASVRPMPSSIADIIAA